MLLPIKIQFSISDYRWVGNPKVENYKNRRQEEYDIRVPNPNVCRILNPCRKFFEINIPAHSQMGGPDLALPKLL